MDAPKPIGHLLRQAAWVYLRPYWKLHVPLALAVILIVTMEICVPLTIRFLIDRALIHHERKNLVAGILMLAVIVFGAIVGRYITAVVSAYMYKELIIDLRIELIHLMRRLPMSYIDTTQPGKFSILFDTELLTLARTGRDFFSKGVYSASQFTVIILTLVVLNWQQALVAIFLLPFLLIPISHFASSSINALDTLRKGVERVDSAVQDYATSQVLARAFGVEQPVTKQFIDNVLGRPGSRLTLRHVSDVRRTMLTPHFRWQIFSMSMDNIMAGIMLIVVSSGAYLTFAGTLTLGTFSAFILLLPIIMKTFSNLSNYIQELGRAGLGLQRFEQLKNAASADILEDETTRLPEPDRAIRFEQVSFGYNKDSPVLRDVNLTLPIGQSVAFVGRSGSGKSTLFRLILGFYHPTTGRVLIDDHDVRRLAVGAPGSRIGTVLQPSILTNGTIRENIGYAKPDATNDEIEEAARMADIHDFIAALPNGYGSRVGAGGRWLSEGQRQRIALARAILPRPGILLLDEVTASLDPATEAAINTTIRKLAAERTVILVTHRLAAAAFVDRLVVVDRGEIKEQGTHEALLAQNGLYAQLWGMQTGFVVSDDGHHAEVSGERLRAIPLFQDVDMEKLNGLAHRFVSEFHDADHLICEEGEAGDKFYIIVRGAVSVSTRGAGDVPVRLADLQDGDYFGEGEMLNRGRRTTTVKAKTPCLVLTLNAEHFLAMLDEISSLNKIVTQMALGRSLSTICSVGRRRRNHSVWQQLRQKVSME